MTKNNFFTAAFLVLFLSAGLSGCIKDKLSYTYQVSTPIYQTLTQYRAQIKSQPASNITSPGKITRYGRYIFLSEANKGIHVIDNSNPAAPRNISFINIPGNEDLAIQGHTLYADAFGDLVSFDISDPAHAIAKNFKTYVFPDRSIYTAFYGGYFSGNDINPDSVLVITGFYTHDTTVDYDPSLTINYGGGCANCQTLVPNFNAASAKTTGTNGSMARFTIINDYLYAVGWSTMTSIDISEPLSPQVMGSQMVSFHVETIYSLKNTLFVGTNNGMFMYDVQANPSAPVAAGEFTHIRGCDPVISDGNYAYVTLNDSSACLGFNNQLQVVDIQNMASPGLVQTYQLTHPMGLSKDGNTLFLCDGKGGLKVYDAKNPANLDLIKELNDGNMYDVIAADGLAMVMASDGIYQYDYTDLNNIHLISKL